MLANVSSLQTPLTPGVGSKGMFFFSESSRVTCQIYRNEIVDTRQANVLPFCTLTTPRWGQKVKKGLKQLFSEKDHVAN